MLLTWFQNLFKTEDKAKKISLLLTDLASLENYISDLFSFSPLPICFVSPLGVVLEINPAFEKTSGFSAEEIIGESIEKIFNKREIVLLSQETFLEGAVTGRELQLLKKEGSFLTVQLFTRVRVDEESRPIGYFLGIFDLSEIKRTNEDLRSAQAALLNILEDSEEARKRIEEEKDKTQAIITNFTDGLFFFDRNHFLVLINPKAEEIFAVKDRKMIGRQITDLKTFPKLRSLIDFLGNEIRETVRAEFSFGRDSIFEVSVIPLDQDGVNLGDLVVLHDVSREKMVERLKTEFVSLAAHQLRTPLSAIKWSVKMFLDGDLGKVGRKQKEILTKTYQSNERMIILVNDLLSVARIEEGKYALTFAPVDIVKTCQAAIDLFGDNFKKKRLKFTLVRPVKRTILAFADGERIKFVVQNFLDNASKYTPTGGKISCVITETARTIRVEVIDSGIGIKEDEQKRVFSKFFRAPEAVLLEPTGSGLGLYMAKNIIEGHGGKIGFFSRLGKGSTFYFVIPKSPAGKHNGSK
jgi:PAS domain S-box-containing protein